jgi:hypothetical protein
MTLVLVECKTVFKSPGCKRREGVEQPVLEKVRRSCAVKD